MHPHPRCSSDEFDPSGVACEVIHVVDGPAGSMQPAKNGTRDMPDLPALPAPESDSGQSKDGSLKAGSSYYAQMQRNDDSASLASDDQGVMQVRLLAKLTHP